jgi:hypothetical protein
VAAVLTLLLAVGAAAAGAAPLPRAEPSDDGCIRIETDRLEAEVRTRGYVSGVAGGTLLDKATGARDRSFGLDIVDFLLGPGDRPGNTYDYGNAYHGRIAKHYVEGPQVCTQAKRLEAEIVRGGDFVAVRQGYTYTRPAAGFKAGSRWDQVLLFPMGRRYFLSADRVTSANAAECVFLRIDMPGHLKHKGGDTFDHVYLSYEGKVPASDFAADFPPDARHLYRRRDGAVPARFIRARKKPGTGGPYLAGITLDPGTVYEAWCHQRGYVCFIQEIGGLAVEPGDRFGAAYAVGYFDSVGAMQATADALRGFTSLAVTGDCWLLAEGIIVRNGPGGEAAGGPGPARFRIVPQGRRPAPETWRVLAHGRGTAVINGRRVEIAGEQMVEVPGTPMP